MVIILDGSTEHVAHAYWKLELFGEKIRLMTVLDITKCLKEIKKQNCSLLFLSNHLINKSTINITN